MFTAPTHIELMPDGPHKGGGDNHGRRTPGVIPTKSGPQPKTPKTKPNPPRNPNKK